MSGATKLRDLQAGTSEIMDSSAMETEEYYNEEGGEWSQKVDTGQLCRVCASPNEYLIPIFDGEGLEHELAMKIQKHLPIKVTETDTLPLHICYQCASTLIAWHDLVISCVEADKKLRELQVEEDDDDEDKGAEMFESHSMDSDPVDEVDQPSTSEAQSQVTKSPAVKKATPNKEKKPKLKMVLVKGPPAGTSGMKTGAKIQVARVLEQAKSKEGGNEESAGERCSEWPELWGKVSSGEEAYEYKEYSVWKDHSYFIQNEDKSGGTTLLIYETVKDETCNETEGMQEALDLYSESMTGVDEFLASIQASKHQRLIQDVKDENEELIDENPQEEQNEYILGDDLGSQEEIIDPDVETIQTEITETKTEEYDESIDAIMPLDEEANEMSSLGYKCEVCEAVLWDGDDYEAHVASHSVETLYACDICGSILKTQHSLQKHLKIHENATKAICEQCGKTFPSNFSVKKHMAHHTEERSFICNKCDKCFSTKFNLKYHDICHTDQRPHKCEICNKTFKRKCDLEAHQVSHLLQSDNYCSVCTDSFPSVLALQKHLLTHTEEDIKESENEQKKVQCHLCYFSFPSKLSLFYHINTHHADSLYSCSTCRKQFTSQDMLDSHKTVHVKKKCMCKTCGKILSSKNTLAEHERIHTGERPYQCHECGKSFRAMSGLHAHQALHSEQRPYVCSECGASFQRRTYLITHIRTHTGEKPYICDVCYRSFAHRTDMMKHRARHNK